MQLILDMEERVDIDDSIQCAGNDIEIQFPFMIKEKKQNEIKMQFQNDVAADKFTCFVLN